LLQYHTIDHKNTPIINASHPVISFIYFLLLQPRENDNSANMNHSIIGNLERIDGEFLGENSVENVTMSFTEVGKLIYTINDGSKLLGDQHGL
jgi:hypothetical protein